MRKVLPHRLVLIIGAWAAGCVGSGQNNPGDPSGAGGVGTGAGGSTAAGGAGGASTGAGGAATGGRGGSGGGGAAGGRGGSGGTGTGGVGTGGASGAAGTSLAMGCTPPSTYGDLFANVLGVSQASVDAKVDAAFQSLFHGAASATVYTEVGTDRAYILDVNDNDVRSEGMSYGMMIAVQLDKKAEFDRLWSWAKQYMYQSSGAWSGYFAWQRTPSGGVVGSAPNPASDGEEYFATALIFASKRWGDGTGIFNYAAEARALLDVMVHKGEDAAASAAGATSMFDPTSKLVVFVPSGSSARFTDPSYVMPAFYDVWACFDTKNAAFWRSASAAGRAFLHTATNATTGLAPEYAGFDGRPSTQAQKGDFRFDAWRVALNVMTDLHFWAVDQAWQIGWATRLGAFFTAQGSYGDQYSLTGTKLSTDHSAGLVAINATLGFALPNADSRHFVQEVWEMAIPTGQFRYYNGMLYMLSMLHASGKFHLWF